MRAYFKLCICFLLSTGVLFAQTDQSNKESANEPKHFENISVGYSTAKIYDTQRRGINVALEIFEIPQGAMIYHGFSANAMGLFSEGSSNFVGVFSFGPKTYWGISGKKPMGMIIAFSTQLSIFTMPLAETRETFDELLVSTRETFSGLSGNLEIKIIDVKNFSLNFIAGAHIGTKYSFKTGSVNISYRFS